jgi:predicted amidophosphoribosyltransferase
MDTGSQAGMTRDQRIANLAGAFTVTVGERLKGVSVLLVDDVITTTATVREAARTLARAGASRIEVAALARAADSVNLAPVAQRG